MGRKPRPKELAVLFLEALEPRTRDNNKISLKTFISLLEQNQSQKHLDLLDTFEICQCEKWQVVARYCEINNWIDYDDYLIGITESGIAKIHHGDRHFKNSHVLKNKDTISNSTLIIYDYNSREDQAEFRKNLIDTYKSCMISGNSVDSVLEAAHIDPYSAGGSTEINNGLLLRSDLHKLFDDHLIIIDIDESGNGVLKIHPSISSTVDYYKFNRLHINPKKETFEAIRKRAQETRNSPNWQEVKE